MKAISLTLCLLASAFLSSCDLNLAAKLKSKDPISVTPTPPSEVVVGEPTQPSSAPTPTFAPQTSKSILDELDSNTDADFSSEFGQLETELQGL